MFQYNDEKRGGCAFFHSNHIQLMGPMISSGVTASIPCQKAVLLSNEKAPPKVGGNLRDDPFWNGNLMGEPSLECMIPNMHMENH